MFPYQERNRNSFSLSASLMVENACFIIKCPFLLLASRPFFLPVLFSPPGNCLLWIEDCNQTKLGQDQKLKCIRNCATYILMFWFTANIKFSSCNLIEKLDVWDAYLLVLLKFGLWSGNSESAGIWKITSKSIAET